MKTFGQQLSEARKAAELTQEQLAEMMGITRQGISGWERDKSSPDLESIKRLSQILKTDFDISESLVPAADAETKALPADEPAVHKPGKKMLVPVVSFIAGALVMFLLMQFIAPLFAPNEPKPGYSINNGPASGVTGPETVVWFTQKETPVPGKPYVEISFSEKICYAKPDPDYENGYGWNYTVYLTEYNGYDFYPETFEKYIFVTESHSGHNVRTADDMTVWWGESVIPARGQRCVSSGEPVQDAIGIGIKVTGKDAKGEYMEFYGYMEYSQEIME